MRKRKLFLTVLQCTPKGQAGPFSAYFVFRFAGLDAEPLGGGLCTPAVAVPEGGKLCVREQFLLHGDARGSLAVEVWLKLSAGRPGVGGPQDGMTFDKYCGSADIHLEERMNGLLSVPFRNPVVNEDAGLLLMHVLTGEPNDMYRPPPTLNTRPTSVPPASSLQTHSKVGDKLLLSPATAVQEPRQSTPPAQNLSGEGSPDVHSGHMTSWERYRGNLPPSPSHGSTYTPPAAAAVVSRPGQSRFKVIPFASSDSSFDTTATTLAPLALIPACVTPSRVLKVTVFRALRLLCVTSESDGSRAFPPSCCVSVDLHCKDSRTNADVVVPLAAQDAPLHTRGMGGGGVLATAVRRDACSPVWEATHLVSLEPFLTPRAAAFHIHHALTIAAHGPAVMASEAPFVPLSRHHPTQHLGTAIVDLSALQRCTVGGAGMDKVEGWYHITSHFDPSRQLTIGQLHVAIATHDAAAAAQGRAARAASPHGAARPADGADWAVVSSLRGLSSALSSGRASADLFRNEQQHPSRDGYSSGSEGPIGRPRVLDETSTSAASARGRALDDTYSVASARPRTPAGDGASSSGASWARGGRDYGSRAASALPERGDRGRGDGCGDDDGVALHGRLRSQLEELSLITSSLFAEPALGNKYLLGSTRA